MPLDHIAYCTIDLKLYFSKHRKHNLNSNWGARISARLNAVSLNIKATNMESNQSTHNYYAT